MEQVEESGFDSCLGAEIFQLNYCVRSVAVDHRDCCLLLAGGHFPWLTRSANHSPQSIVELKNW